MKALLRLCCAALIGALSTSAPGCYWEVDGAWTWPVWVDNWSPVVVDADAGCFWDQYLHDEVWYFEAEVDDYDGLSDIVAVEALVYDEWRGDRWVDGFDLEPTADPWVWYTEVRASRTALDCTYPGYVVEFWVWDWFDAVDVLAVYPRTL